MTNRTTTRTRKARGTKPAVNSAAIRAKETADRVAEDVEKLTPAQRRKVVARLRREMAIYGPTLAAAKSDLLLLLNSVAAEFVRTYYPDASSACVIITRYPPQGGSPEYSVHLPLACPAAKGGA